MASQPRTLCSAAISAAWAARASVTGKRSRRCRPRSRRTACRARSASPRPRPSAAATSARRITGETIGSAAPCLSASQRRLVGWPGSSTLKSATQTLASTTGILSTLIFDQLAGSLRRAPGPSDLLGQAIQLLERLFPLRLAQVALAPLRERPQNGHRFSPESDDVLRRSFLDLVHDLGGVILEFPYANFACRHLCSRSRSGHLFVATA